jgi:hypothetical protein
MISEPLKITGPSYIGREPGTESPRTMRIWPTNHGPMSKRQLCMAAGLKLSTFERRIWVGGNDADNLLDELRQIKPRRRELLSPGRSFPGRRAVDSIPLGTWERQQLLAGQG